VPGRKKTIMPTPLRVLIVEDRLSDARLLVAELQRAGFEVDWKRVESEPELLAGLEERPDIILSDYSLPQFDALRVLHLLRESGLDIPLIMVSGTVGEDVAVAAMRQGAADYLLKDRLGRLGPAIAQALDQKALREAKRQAEQSLRESEMRTRLILDTANDPFISMNAEGRITDWNVCAETVFGWSREEAVGRRLDETIIPAGLRKSHEAGLKKYLATGEGPLLNKRIEISALHRDGHEFPVEVVIWPVVVSGTYTFNAFVRDITLRKQTEADLREREARIRLLLDSTAEAIYGVDLQGSCTFANNSCARILGFAAPEELLGKNMHALIHHTRRDGTPYQEDECLIYQAFQSGNDTHADDEVFWRANGNSFPVEYWSHPIRQDGQVIGSVVTFLDITERWRLVRRFREAQERLQHVVGSSPAVLYSLAVEEGNIHPAWFSENVRDMLGYTVEEALHPDWWFQGIHPEDLQWVTATMNDDLFSAGRVAIEYRFRHQDGKYRWIRSEMRLLRDASGKPEEIIGSWSDITERKQIEEQFRQSQKMEAVGRLAGGVAHDFNNLLTVIIGYGDILMGNFRPEDPLHDLASEIHKAGERAARLTRQLLAFSRKQVLNATVLDLNVLVQDMDKMLRRLVQEDIDVQVHADADLWPVKVDPGQIEQVIMNLVVNARDAMPQGGRLTIETSNVQLDLS
jgi:PAS domain S-box-containing protein